jgi:hypothetical protein
MDGYRERLTAPFSWWVAAALFGGICGWIMVVAANPTWGAVTAVAATAAAAGLVWTYGSLTMRAGHDGLHVGPAFLARDFIGSAEALDRPEFQSWLGPDADARAWLRTRPYVEGGVRITVTDSGDPVPYWLISSRRPAAVVAALDLAVGQTEAANNEGTVA